jgi:hypothetical protein
VRHGDEGLWVVEPVDRLNVLLFGTVIPKDAFLSMV